MPQSPNYARPAQPAALWVVLLRQPQQLAQRKVPIQLVSVFVLE